MLPKLGKLHLNEITRQVVQDFLFEFTNVGKNRTAQKLKQMLHAIFDVARKDYNLKSPMSKIVLSHYEVKKGHALTIDEELQLVEYCKSNTRYAGNSALLILLYTGMRVGELKSIENDDCYITCVSEKTRKGRKDVIRKIPISPMLRRVMHLVDFDEAKTISREAVRSLLKRIFPDKYTHELRYSFITRANVRVQKGNYKKVITSKQPIQCNVKQKPSYVASDWLL